MTNEKIAVLDFGSQYAHLIAKRFRLLGYYSEIALPSVSLDFFDNARGIVFSGGPSSVYEKNIPEFNSDILNLDIPILGLCYGHQLMTQEYGGTVEKTDGEFGIAYLDVKDTDGREYPENPLLRGIQFPMQVWMSHQDAVTSPAGGFEVTGSTKDCRFAALQNSEKKRFSLQFHAEVKDTPDGDTIFRNFAGICGMSKNWDQDEILNTIQSQILEDAGSRKVLLFLSGGVDSTVAFALLNKTLGQDRVLGLHIDNGFMRKNESAVIAERYKNAGFTNFIVEDASDRFLKAVYHETDPQKKRKAIGETFITVRDEVVKKIGLREDEWLLGQGTLYPDIIESGGTKNSNIIKTHHNRVEGIQALIEKGLIIEPLKDLYKDEVRIIGKKIGLPDELVYRHPFPGPGLSINVLCSTGKDSDEAELVEAGRQISAFPLSHYFTECESTPGTAGECRPGLSGAGVLPVKSVGVQGDFRTYRYPAALSFSRIFNAFPSWVQLEKASSDITNKIMDVNRTVLELWKRQDSVMSLREGYCDKNRLDQTREADAIVLEELKKSDWYRKIFQHLTINLPYAANPGHCSIVLRPVVSEDVMTARFAHIDTDILEKITERISLLPFVDAVYYDITNKPPRHSGGSRIRFEQKWRKSLRIIIMKLSQRISQPE
ncbi:glutamine-hydrolyzing GMP synthase [Brucepastera parasyntrophica]|uniref:glutamine-hydrolyzing GMP synthase n=1 Tax=Brucepastera parasyntrophica TaxID=2880008 RepID=UPI00210A0A38|nr:glutamine-hydrolyzing GMP synthase [Brucepastera parasyntrophica]ULQ60630.1 glutamine-hydrolyzing GMP synthase [Brucepastera parasyntrophica]